MIRYEAYGSRVVLSHGEPAYGDDYNARDVWVFETDGRYFMHYDAAGPLGWLAALATSDDGVSWTKHGPVLSLGEPGSPDSASASYGTTFFDGDRWHMFYLGTPNVTQDRLRTPSFPYRTMKAEAESPTGPWRKRPDRTPFTTKPATWYSETASPGHIIATDDGFLMFFSAAATTADGNILRTLGVARAADLDGPWTVDADPLLPPTEQIENSSLYFEPDDGGWWFLFTNHVGRADGREPELPQETSEYTDAVWVYWARTLDGFTVEHKAVVLDADNSDWSPRIVGLPSVIPIGGRLAVYFDGSREDTIGHGGRDIGVAWLDLPLRPPS